ncbi:MAG: FMN-binding protein [Spirochaetota bacterium]|nr:MAG: FMN-binding protein [Spirochaetota bacterium]
MKGIKMVLPFFVLISLASCSAQHMEFDFSPYLHPKSLTDGEYIGEVNQGLDKAKVKVVILNGNIVEVEVLKVLGFGWRQKAAKSQLPSQFIEKQGIDIDGVTGATGSAIAVKIAVSRALKQSMAE